MEQNCIIEIGLFECKPPPFRRARLVVVVALSVCSVSLTPLTRDHRFGERPLGYSMAHGKFQYSGNHIPINSPCESSISSLLHCHCNSSRRCFISLVQILLSDVSHLFSFVVTIFLLSKTI